MLITDKPTESTRHTWPRHDIRYKYPWHKIVVGFVFTAAFLANIGLSVITYNSSLPKNARADGATYNVNTYGSLQATINAAPDGSNIHVPAGTWSGAATLTSRNNLTVYGDGPSSILVGPGSAGILQIFDSTNITVRDLSINGDYSTNVRGIGIFNLETATFKGLHIKDMTNSGIFSNGRLTDATFLNNRIEHCGDFGITLQSKDNTDDSYNCPIDIMVDNNYFDGFESKNYPAHAIYFSHTIGGTARGNEIHNVWNPGAARNASGITISRASTNVTIENNLIDNSNFGLHIAGGELSDDAYITNTIVRNNSFSNITASGILFYVNTDNTTVDLNTFRSTTYYAITQYPDTGNHTNIHITNNIAIGLAYNPPVYSIFLQHAGIVQYTNNSWQGGYAPPVPTPTPAPYISGDINGDNHTSLTDLSILGANFGTSGRERYQGDLNCDGSVNIYDLSILAAHWGL